MLHTAYISLGSNVGDRQANLREAISRLVEAGNVSRVSSWYETEPVEFIEQPWFLNAALKIETHATPLELMRTLLSIERAMGRERNRPKGPRNIDLDLLLYDDEIVNTPELTLPHPAMHQRRFVLAPLAEIEPQAMHPLLRKTAQELLETLPAGPEVRRVTTVKE
jgi:2-amino-4-hydroxy-6-hydroxymethyldihydropteridine diphosphokinase